jgi:glycine/D-amino acid oxidase-like deaminating enzyme
MRRDRRGRRRSRDRAQPCPPRPRDHRARDLSRYRYGDQFPQQRGHSRGHLLSTRISEGALEPALACVGALWSPSTGIVDTHGYMLALQADFEQAGGSIAFDSPLEHAGCTPQGIRLNVDADASTELEAAIVINSAGCAISSFRARKCTAFQVWSICMESNRRGSPLRSRSRSTSLRFSIPALDIAHALPPADFGERPP